MIHPNTNILLLLANVNLLLNFHFVSLIILKTNVLSIALHYKIKHYTLISSMLSCNGSTSLCRDPSSNIGMCSPLYSGILCVHCISMPFRRVSPFLLVPYSGCQDRSYGGGGVSRTSSSSLLAIIYFHLSGTKRTDIYIYIFVTVVFIVENNEINCVNDCL